MYTLDIIITGNLELICIGPLTNIAQMIDRDPNFGDKIKHCYIMGGNFKGKHFIMIYSRLSSQIGVDFSLIKKVGASFRFYRVIETHVNKYCINLYLLILKTV